MSREAPLSLVLLGMSGVGKSAAGNTILAREEFESEISPSSLTLRSKRGEGEVCGRRVIVVDTPGLFNTELSEQELREEMQMAVSLCGPEPTAFLLVIQLGRFTQQEKRVMETLQDLFSKRVNQRTVVLFTYGDRLGKKNIEEVINNDTNLLKLLQKCGNRYHVFNNQQREDGSQVSKLLQKIEEMVDHNKTKEEGDTKKKRTRDEEGGQERFEELRMVLVGKTGVGKSASGNTILGIEQFESELSCSSVTSRCEKATGEVCGRWVAVIDTPGLFDTTFSHDDVKKEIGYCISLSSPGPHVFLVVIQLGRFTDEEQETVEIIQETFGAESANYTMVLFTHGDELKKTTVEQFLSGNKKLAEFTDQCRGGYHVFNNKDMQNRSQVSELLQKIDKAVATNGGRYYTNEMYRKAEKAIEGKMVEIQIENKEMSEKEARAQAERENDVLKSVVASLTCSAVGAGLGGAILGPAGIAAGYLVGAGVGAGVGAAIGAAIAIKASEKCAVQ